MPYPYQQMRCINVGRKTPRFITKIMIIREINICITKLSEEAVRKQIIFSLILKKWPPQPPENQIKNATKNQKPDSSRCGDGAILSTTCLSRVSCLFSP